MYDDYIYFGDLEGYLHKLDPNTGETLGLQSTRLEAISQIEGFSNKIIAIDSAGSLSVFDLK